jgi:3-phosphoshikimate 1-carboxyvinyltransferase
MSTLQTRPGRPFVGSVDLPGDKSISHRALLFNGLAEGTAMVRGLLESEDVRATRRCIEAMGVQVDDVDGGVRVHGRAMQLREPSQILDCGNSGTSMRLLSGVVAGQDLCATLTGDRHLLKRPMGRVTGPLRAMGAQILSPRRGRLPPLTIQGGRLHAGAYWSPLASAQVKSCLMLATLGATGTLRFKEPSRSRDHSERMLRAMGVELTEEPDGTLVLAGGQCPRSVDVVVPRDISSAAFFLVAACITPGSELRLPGVGLNPSRAGILDALWAMGADITVENPRDVGGEPVGDLVARTSELTGTAIAGDLIPRLIDEVPVLAVAAAFADGPTVIRDAEELRVKESDRIRATVLGLQAVGVRVDERPDGMLVHPEAWAGGTVDSHGDHRIAMAFAVGGCAGAETHVLDTDNVATSFPSFPALLESARG